jgi:hypothetical protein
MTLFDSNPQYREKATIFRVFSLLPLFSSLLAGCVCRWFAINIPMDLGTNDGHAGDLDIIACMKRWPNNRSPWPSNLTPWPYDTPRNGTFYRTWEVKVAKLHADGETHSLKGGKTRRILSQLDVHRKCGSPSVSLLDVYLLEAGIGGKGVMDFPPAARQSIRAKISELRSKRYGYQILPFGHYKGGDIDVGVFAPRVGANMNAGFDVLYPAVSPPQQPFSKLASHIESVWESKRTAGPFQQMVVFCRACRSLNVVSTKTNDFSCPECHDDLVAQS